MDRGSTRIFPRTSCASTRTVLRFDKDIRKDDKGPIDKDFRKDGSKPDEARIDKDSDKRDDRKDDIKKDDKPAREEIKKTDGVNSPQMNCLTELPMVVHPLR